MASDTAADAVTTKALADTDMTTVPNTDDEPTSAVGTKSSDLEPFPVTADRELEPTSNSTSVPKTNPDLKAIESVPVFAKEVSKFTTIESLPNELLSHVFSFLDVPPPSADTKDLIDEPKFDLTTTAIADLKASSCVSKLWRKAILPRLFRHARFVVTKPEPKMPVRNLETEIQSFLEFVKKNTLLQVIITFVLVVADRSVAGDEVVPEHKLDLFANFWHLLFRTIDPVELLIIAHPETLGRFTSCQVYAADDWNFDCPCHYLRLRRPTDLSKQPIANDEPGLPSEVSTCSNPLETVEPTSSIFSTDTGAEDLQHDATSTTVTDSLRKSESPRDPTDSTPESSSSVAFDSELEDWQSLYPQASVLFEIRPWSSILLNEGSFIKAYSTYEFWLRKAPSILSDMVGADDQLSGALISPTIREMEYIGIFPMASHFASLTRHLPRLDSLYVQLVPRNDILNNSAKMVQVEMEDLWMERNSCYALLMRELFNAPPIHNYKYLQIFESGDAADTEAWLMAVEYVKRAGNGWKVAGDGVFERNPEDLTPEPEEGVEAEDSSSFEGALIRWAWNGITKLPVSAYPLYENPMGPLS